MLQLKSSKTELGFASSTSSLFHSLYSTPFLYFMPSLYLLPFLYLSFPQTPFKFVGTATRTSRFRNSSKTERGQNPLTFLAFFLLLLYISLFLYIFPFLYLFVFFHIPLKFVETTTRTSCYRKSSKTEIVLTPLNFLVCFPLLSTFSIYLYLPLYIAVLLYSCLPFNISLSL